MTTYNGSKYIKEQLDSILDQSFADYELIICDDCSSDDTQLILKKYSKKDSRIKIIFNETNIGFIKNFEQAIKLCTGDYIAFSDQDDIWKKNHLQELVDNIKDNLMICSDSLLFNDKGTICSMKESLTLDFIPEQQDMFYYLLFNNFVQGSTSLVKKELFNYVNEFYNNQVFFHDHWLALYAAYLNKLVYLDKQLLLYRQHESNVTNNKKKSFYNLLQKTKKRSAINDREKILKKFCLTQNTIKNNMLLEAIKFYKQNTLKDRINSIRYLMNNYKKIYATRTYKYCFARVIKLLLQL